MNRATILVNSVLRSGLQGADLTYSHADIVNAGRLAIHASTYKRMQSSVVGAQEQQQQQQDFEIQEGPEGDLFNAEVGPSLVGKTASIQRTFDSKSNAIGLLTCGGEVLAKHASFDPQYTRARDWIRHHAVGPASLSPVLISGLIGALVEASVPQSIPISCSMKQLRPLIVGVEVEAKIEVVEVTSDHHNMTATMEMLGRGRENKKGYSVGLNTLVCRVRDGVRIAEGAHTIWIPDYLHF